MKSLEEALADVRDGSRDAINLVYNHTYKQVYALCYSYMRNEIDATAIALDTYYNVRKYINSYKPNTNAIGWICMIAKNLCKNKLKADSKTVAIDEFYDGSLVEENNNDKEHQEEELLKVMNKVLNNKELYIVINHITNDLTFGEIAKSTNSNENTVRWAYNNALKKVRKYLGKEKQNEI